MSGWAIWTDVERAASATSVWLALMLWMAVGLLPGVLPRWLMGACLLSLGGAAFVVPWCGETHRCPHAIQLPLAAMLVLAASVCLAVAPATPQPSTSSTYRAARLALFTLLTGQAWLHAHCFLLAQGTGIGWSLVYFLASVTAAACCWTITLGLAQDGNLASWTSAPGHNLRLISRLAAIASVGLWGFALAVLVGLAEVPGLAVGTEPLEMLAPLVATTITTASCIAWMIPYRVARCVGEEEELSSRSSYLVAGWLGGMVLAVLASLA
ncbi:MAG: hypothetical protein KatS3mg111_0372 [Pirellulaceae bacterium]|nr:MAG: hypothetical protein KatS3mg111_0372 [Pirellulaceae bacterium]